MPSKSFLKMLSLVLLLSVGPATIYFFYARTGGLESRKEISFHKKLRFAFMADTDTLPLDPLTEWPWERVCSLRGGLGQAAVDEVVGFHYEDYPQLTWRNLEDHWTLLFIDKERETNWGMHRPVTPVRIPDAEIADYSFADGEGGQCAPRNGASLSITRTMAPVGRSPIVVRLVDEADGSAAGP